MLSIFILVGVLSISFILIMMASIKEFELNLKYPPTACEFFENKYNENEEKW